MADSIRELIISGFETRMATMTLANGYVVGAGATIFRASKHIDAGDLPACAIWPSTEDVLKNYGQHECTMKMRVEAIGLIGLSNPSEIQEKLLADLKRCIFDMSVVISSYIDGIVYTTGGPAEFPSGEDTITAAYVEFNIKYNEKIGDPYSN